MSSMKQMGLVWNHNTMEISVLDCIFVPWNENFTAHRGSLGNTNLNWTWVNGSLPDIWKQSYTLIPWKEFQVKYNISIEDLL